MVQHRVSVLLDADEVTALGALAKRTNSTLLPFLKTAWAGKTLATQNAEAARLRWVGAQCYRLAVVCGVQPEHAGVILDDESGGFPQRWIWMPTYDAGMLGHDVQMTEPDPWVWTVPANNVEIGVAGVTNWPPLQQMTLPDVAVAAILKAAEDQNRPIGALAPASSLDGHALLTRAKVAGLFALLDGRADVVTVDDWQLAGTVMAISDHTRDAVIKTRGVAARKAADSKAARMGRSAAIASDSEAKTRTVRCMGVIRTAMEKRPGSHSTTDLRHFAGSRYRDDALSRMQESGEIIAEERECANSRRATFYRLAVSS